MTTATDYKTAAEAIRQQIARALLMIGASNLMCGENAGRPFLSFKVGRNAEKITHVTITLEPSDTYKVEFFRCRKYERETMGEVEMVYADALRGVIGDRLGMATSL